MDYHEQIRFTTNVLSFDASTESRCNSCRTRFSTKSYHHGNLFFPSDIIWTKAFAFLIKKNYFVVWLQYHLQKCFWQQVMLNEYDLQLYPIPIFSPSFFIFFCLRFSPNHSSSLFMDHETFDTWTYRLEICYDGKISNAPLFLNGYCAALNFASKWKCKFVEDSSQLSP